MMFTVGDLLLSPERARFLALDLLAGMNPRGMEPLRQEEEFQAHYGTSSTTIANQWFDLCIIIIIITETLLGLARAKASAGLYIG